MFWPICDFGSTISFRATCYESYLLRAFARKECRHFIMLLIAMMLRNRRFFATSTKSSIVQPLPRLPIILLTPSCANKLPYDSIGLLQLVIILLVVYARDFTRLLACEFAPICEQICKLWKSITEFYESIVVELHCNEARK
jgi:hypothetical protein